MGGNDYVTEWIRVFLVTLTPSVLTTNGCRKRTSTARGWWKRTTREKRNERKGQVVLLCALWNILTWVWLRSVKKISTRPRYRSCCITNEVFHVSIGMTRDYWLQKWICVKNVSWNRAMLQIDKVLYHLENYVLESTSYLLPLSSKTSFSECYG